MKKTISLLLLSSIMVLSGCSNGADKKVTALNLDLDISESQLYNKKYFVNKYTPSGASTRYDGMAGTFIGYNYDTKTTKYTIFNIFTGATIGKQSYSKPQVITAGTPDVPVVLMDESETSFSYYLANGTRIAAWDIDEQTPTIELISTQTVENEDTGYMTLTYFIRCSGVIYSVKYEYLPVYESPNVATPTVNVVQSAYEVYVEQEKPNISRPELVYPDREENYVAASAESLYFTYDRNFTNDKQMISFYKESTYGKDSFPDAKAYASITLENDYSAKRVYKVTDDNGNFIFFGDYFIYFEYNLEKESSASRYDSSTGARYSGTSKDYLTYHRYNMLTKKDEKFTLPYKIKNFTILKDNNGKHTIGSVIGNEFNGGIAYDDRCGIEYVVNSKFEILADLTLKPFSFSEGFYKLKTNRYLAVGYMPSVQSPRYGEYYACIIDEDYNLVADLNSHITSFKIESEKEWIYVAYVDSVLGESSAIIDFDGNNVVVDTTYSTGFDTASKIFSNKFYFVNTYGDQLIGDVEGKYYQYVEDNIYSFDEVYINNTLGYIFAIDSNNESGYGITYSIYVYNYNFELVFELLNAYSPNILTVESGRSALISIPSYKITVDSKGVEHFETFYTSYLFTK